MSGFRFVRGWDGEKWCTPLYVAFNHKGELIHIGASLTKELEQNSFESIDGILIPGFINAHSHAFQYAMAGLAEHTNARYDNDSFWTWRDTMYQLALKLEPDELQAIATMAYSEMLRMGYVSVVEFHYLHHDISGAPYNNPSELSERLIAAAYDAGIDLLLVPVFYQTAGFDKPATPEQRRFVFSDIDHYERLCDSLSLILGQNNAPARVSSGIHSLRAAPLEAVAAVWARNDCAIHLHIAEQLAEVNQCLSFYGQRPVSYLIDKFGVDSRHHLVHATHLDTSEIKALATSKASVVICPSTEANLGDGFFPLKEYSELGGKWSIGSDSHVCLNPCEELRWLEYGVRLQMQRRNPLVNEKNPDSGSILYQMAYATGRKAAGIPLKNSPYDWNGVFRGVVLDASHPCLAAKADSQLFSSLVFASDQSVIMGNLKQDSWLVKSARHERQDNFRGKYHRCLNAVFSR